MAGRSSLRRTNAPRFRRFSRPGVASDGLRMTGLRSRFKSDSFLPRPYCVTVAQMAVSPFGVGAGVARQIK
jgi:hypothetical protein